MMYVRTNKGEHVNTHLYILYMYVRFLVLDALYGTLPPLRPTLDFNTKKRIITCVCSRVPFVYIRLCMNIYM